MAASAVVLAALLAGIVGTILALVRAIDAEGVAEQRLDSTKIAVQVAGSRCSGFLFRRVPTPC